MLQQRSQRWLMPFALAQLVALITAQSTAQQQATTASASITKAPSATSSSSSRPPKTFTVEVGPGDFIYKPDRIEDVLVNDTVLFQFFPPDHSVARAEYLNPCVPYESTGANKVGFWSGVQYVDTVEHITNWTLLINDTEPIFYYCTAPGSCIDHQMVGVINPNATQTLNAQKDAAKKAKFMVAPNEEFPSEASSTASAPSGGATAPSSSTPSTSEHHGTHLSGGAIAGIVVGAVAFLCLCAALFFYVGRTKSLKEVIHRRDATVSKTTPVTPGTEFTGTPGYPSPFSPTHAQAEAGYGGGPPTYGQHNVTETHPSGWASPHASVATPPPQMAEYKPGYAPAEMASPTPGQTTFTAELEAPIKSPRG